MGITGQYVRRLVMGEDDDETWDVSAMRRATDAEVIGGTLSANLS